MAGMKPSRRLLRLSALLAVALAGVLRADSLRLDYSGSSAGLQGSAEYSHALGGPQLPELVLDYTRSRSYGSVEDAYSSLARAGADGPIWDALQGSAEVGYEVQELYNIRSWQPAVGLRWRWRGEADAEGSRPSWLKLSLDLPMAFYSMDTKVPAPSGPGPGPGPGGRPRTVDKKLSLNKAAPKAKLSLPLFTQHAWAWASYTAYAYDKDPLELTDAALSIQPPGSPLAARLDSLNSQLLRRAWSFGGSVDLPWDFGAAASFGRAQSVVDDSTNSDVDLSLDWSWDERFGLSAGWTRWWDGSGILDQGNAGVWVDF